MKVGMHWFIQKCFSPLLNKNIFYLFGHLETSCFFLARKWSFRTFLEFLAILRLKNIARWKWPDGSVGWKAIHTPKGCCLDPQLGHIPRFRSTPGRGAYGRQLMDASLAHRCPSLSLTPLPLPPSSVSKLHTYSLG